MKTEVNIKEVGNQLIIREGKAPEIYDPLAIVLNGTITAPADFADKRKEVISPLETNVVANFTDRTIRLTVNESSRFKTEIKGTLEMFADLAEMQINGKKTYTSIEFLNMIKFKGSYFKDKEQHTSLLGALKAFEAKVAQEFQNANDYKGAAATKKVVDIKTNVGLEFSLSLPIFTGGEHTSFLVDVCVDINNGGVIFWLESIQLHDLITKGTEHEFKKQLDRLMDYVIIKTW
jgi:hypothetical protein